MIPTGRKIGFFLILFVLGACLGRTAKLNPEGRLVRKHFIPLEKGKLWIPPVVNYTSHFQLGFKVKEAIETFFEHYSDFTLLREQHQQSADIYLSVWVNDYRVRKLEPRVSPFGIVNSEWILDLGLLIQDKPPALLELKSWVEPEAPPQSKVYFQSRSKVFSAYYDLDEQHPFKNRLEVEKKFFRYLAGQMEHFLNEGQFPPVEYESSR